MMMMMMMTMTIVAQVKSRWRRVHEDDDDEEAPKNSDTITGQRGRIYSRELREEVRVIPISM